MTLIACVKTGTAYGPEYVTRLRDGVTRNCHAPHEFVCFTDVPVDGVKCEPLAVPLPGWWSKLCLYQMRRPCIYFDLDVVITGDLQPLLDWQGFGAIKNQWAWLGGYNSSVLKLTGNEGVVWDKFSPAVLARYRGDQEWLSAVYPGQPTFPPQWFPSWKLDALFKLDGPPAGAIATYLAGRPKPHEIGKGWIKDYWTGNIPAAAA